MRSKFGKIWRITMAMVLVAMLLPVLAVASPVGADPTPTPCPGLNCENVVVTVSPEVVDCDAEEEYKCFNVDNDGCCPIYTFHIEVPVDEVTGWPVYDITGVSVPTLDWNAYYWVHVDSGRIIRIRWYTSTDPIECGEDLGFAIDTKLPGAGTYTWYWYVWETTQTCVEACEPVDPDCCGEVYQTVDCDDPEVYTECIGMDCPTQCCENGCGTMGPGNYDVEATITDESAWAGIEATLYYVVNECCDYTGEWEKVPMDESYDPIEDEVTATGTIPEQGHGDTVCYYIEAKDMAGHTGVSECCCFVVDQEGPDLGISIEPAADCYPLGELLTITVTSDEDVYDDEGNPDVPVVVVTDGACVDHDITDTVNPIGEPNEWEYTFETAVDCCHTVTATAYDCVGNEGQAQEYFAVDGIAPPCPEVSGEACPLENKLWWSCVDDCGVHCPDGNVFYRVYRNGGLIYTSGVGECYPVDPWIDHTGGLVDGEEYCYEVRAVDERNNESSGCDLVCMTYFEGIPPQDYAFDICAGWNMISLPKIPFDSSTEAVLLGVLDEEGEVVWGYDPDTGWHYRDHEGSGELAHMVDGQGYWLYSLKADTVTGQGWDLAVGPATPPLYPVKAGWNLIGFKSQYDMPAFAYLWKMLVTDISAHASLQAGFNLWTEWWEEFGYADWIAWGGCSIADWECDPGPCEELWYKWWLFHGEAAWYEWIWRTGGSMWLEVEAGLEIALDNMQVIVLGYDCDCYELSFYPVGTMKPGLGYWLYSPEDREILPMPMEWLWFLTAMGGGCGPGGCFR